MRDSHIKRAAASLNEAGAFVGRLIKALDLDTGDGQVSKLLESAAAGIKDAQRDLEKAAKKYRRLMPAEDPSNQEKSHV